jgi:NTP pyrophosphatase (non-canonical NTP hydrolase)
MSLTLKSLQHQQAEWSERNFPDQKPYQCLLGLIEEVGELAHAHLKMEQGIRTNEDHLGMKKDAVGDIVTYLAGYCTSNGLNFEECVWNAWSEVKRRDWRKREQKERASIEENIIKKLPDSAYEDTECRHTFRFENKGVFTCRDCGATYDEITLEWVKDE